MRPRFFFPLMDEHGAPGSGANPPAPPPAIGGPADPAKNPAAPPAAAPPKPVYEGAGGVFQTPEELANYTRSLEVKLVQQAMVPPPPASTIPVPPPTTKSVLQQVSEEIFVNTDVALEKLVTHVREEVRSENRSVDNRKKFWETFYSENTDLRGVEFIVDLVEREHASLLAPLSLTEAKKLIATKSRERVHQVKRAAGITETEMPSGSGTVVGSSGSGAPPPKATGATQAISFSDQVKQMQRRRRG